MGWGRPVFLLLIETPTVMAVIAIAISPSTHPAAGRPNLVRAKRAGVVPHAAWTTESRAKQPPQQGRSLTNFERHQLAIEVRIVMRDLRALLEGSQAPLIPDNTE
jgi:hypothetical protein